MFTKGRADITKQKRVYIISQLLKCKLYIFLLLLLFIIHILVRSFQTLLIISNGISLLHICVQQNITIHDISVVNYLLR